jgi:hypothetical protein
MAKTEDFELDQPVTPESLDGFLNAYFPKRQALPHYNTVLIEDLTTYDIGFSEILSSYIKLKDFLLEKEKEEVERINTLPIYDRPPYDGIKNGEDYKGWTQVGIVFLTLDLTNEKYWQGRLDTIPIPEHHIELISKWKKELSCEKNNI